MRKLLLCILLFSVYIVSPVLAQDEIDYEARNGLFANFDDETYSWFTWDCAAPSTVEFYVDLNPDQSGINTSDSVAFFNTSSCTYEGVACNARFIPIDFSEETVFKVKVWPPDTGLNFLFKLEDYNNNSISYEVAAKTTKIEEWEELSFDFTGAPSNTYQRIALFPDFGGTNEYEWWFDDIRLGEAPSTVKIADNPVKQYQLLQNFPNPFNSSTLIRYSLQKSDHITLKIYNLVGQEIAQLINEHQMAGEHQIRWTGDDLPSGLYFCQLHTGEFSTTKKLILQK